MSTPLTNDDRRELVWAAIRRARAAQAEWRNTEADPTADSDDRRGAKDHMRSCEAEFAWQMENVEALLKEDA